MTKEKIYDRICDILRERQTINMETVSLETNVQEELNADSVDLMEFVITLEDEFGIEVPDEVVDRLVTLQDVVDYVAEQTK